MLVVWSERASESDTRYEERIEKGDGLVIMNRCHDMDLCVFKLGVMCMLSWPVWA